MATQTATATMLQLDAASPSFTVNDLEKSRQFYCDLLGFQVSDRWERDGKLLGLELVTGSCLVGLSQDDFAKGRNRQKGVGMRIYFGTIVDIDAFADALAERGIAVRGPEDAPWAARVLHVTDPDGFQITFFRETDA
jgi:catechol 2,3-dioxygenase-like lactoylglutathione lyase family enzyme